MAGYYVHPSSYVDEGATIGDGSSIWHFCHVMKEATIGAGCSLGQNTFVATGVRIGDRCRIQNNVSLYEGVTLEDDVFCGPSCVFTNVIFPRVEFPRHGVYEKTLVKKGASLGANATVVCGVTIGRYALVGAGSVVTRNVPDFAIVIGVPARDAGWVCKCGTKLRFEASAARCGFCGRIFRKLTDSRIVPREDE